MYVQYLIIIPQMNCKITKILYGTAYQQISNLVILVVGVGGIGCQVLKCLCKMPLKQLDILDLDTIQTSNLNRQFLFKQCHRGLSKALTARQTILNINPKILINAHHGNIKEKDINFFKQFNLVIMALDNVEARTFVNTICVRYNIPLIDAGTLGYKGQVTFIKTGISKCYNCEPKQTKQKTYPVCTIRARPQKPIHCIVWAKFIFEVLFGPESDENILSDFSNLAKHIKESQGFQNYIATQLFHNEIKKIKGENEQNILNSVNLLPKEQLEQQNLQNLLARQEQSFLSTIQNINIYISLFKQSLAKLASQTKKLGFLVFQKDDDNIMHFIVAAANLRMHTFKIPLLDFFKIKQMAGNIIPAIASTNSIVSGIQITESLKYIGHKVNLIRQSYVQNTTEKVMSIKLQKPNQNCMICSQKMKPVIIETNIANFTLSNLTNLIQQNKPNLSSFSINFGISQIFNTDQEYSEIYLNKTLRNFFKQDIINLTITNEDTSNIACFIMISHNQTKQLLDLTAFNNSEIQMEAILKLNNMNNEKQEEKKPQTKQFAQKDGMIDLDSDNNSMEIEQLNDESDDLMIIEQFPKQSKSKAKTDVTINAHKELAKIDLSDILMQKQIKFNDISQ